MPYHIKLWPVVDINDVTSALKRRETSFRNVTRVGACRLTSAALMITLSRTHQNENHDRVRKENHFSGLGRRMSSEKDFKARYNRLSKARKRRKNVKGVATYRKTSNFFRVSRGKKVERVTFRWERLSTNTTVSKLVCPSFYRPSSD